MSRLFYLLVIAVIMTGCCSTPHGYNFYKDRVLEYTDTTDISKIIWDFTTELHHDKRLNLETSYVCAEPFNSTIRMQFNSMAILEMCEARQLLVYVVDGLLDRINNSAVSQQLRPYPFTADQIQVTINFEAFYGVYNDPFYIGCIIMENGMVYYYAFNIKDDYLHRWHLDKWNSRFEKYFQSRMFAYQQQNAEAAYKKAHPPKSTEALKESRYLDTKPK